MSEEFKRVELRLPRITLNVDSSVVGDLMTNIGTGIYQDVVIAGPKLKYWVSSRGDKWFQVEASSADEAASIKALEWADEGYRGPFAIMVSVSGLEEPPKAGSAVHGYLVDVIKKVEVKKLSFARLQ